MKVGVKAREFGFPLNDDFGGLLYKNDRWIPIGPIFEPGFEFSPCSSGLGQIPHKGSHFLEEWAV